MAALKLQRLHQCQAIQRIIVFSKNRFESLIHVLRTDDDYEYASVYVLCKKAGVARHDARLGNIFGYGPVCFGYRDPREISLQKRDGLATIVGFSE
uniref:Uncharacterized protein n=1 Tax=Hyaloperonospora arabidopsidis (strain Emoy2) TaxID=559515 RepID=M4BUZ4_HYAAE